MITAALVGTDIAPSDAGLNFVYGLADPLTGEIRYTGGTTQGVKRPKQHTEPYYLKLDGHTHKACWIRKLLSLGLKPDIVVLEQCSSRFDVFRTEQRVIASLRAKGARLTNYSDGGRGGPLGIIRSPETRAKMAAAKRGKKRPEWVRLKVIEGRKRRFQNDPIAVERRRQVAVCLGSSRKGKTHSTATRAKMSVAKRGHIVTTECRSKISDSLRRYYQTAPKIRPNGTASLILQVSNSLPPEFRVRDVQSLIQCILGKERTYHSIQKMLGLCLTDCFRRLRRGVYTRRT